MLDTTTNLKSLLKDHNWPLMLIFSGIPSLAAHIKREEQLDRLLRTVSFDGINLSEDADREEMLHLVFSYADKAGLKVEDLVTDDFLERLDFAACHRWGLVIEILIEAFSLAALTSSNVCRIDHFSKSFSEISGMAEGYSPFTMPNYHNHFDQGKMLEMIEKSRRKNTRKQTRSTK